MASSYNVSKAAEGDKLIAEGQKCLKTSFFKWNPDYDGAASAFDKAGLCYRNASAKEKAKDAYERAADTHFKNNSLFMAGKALEQVANLCKDIGGLEQAADYLERASAMYHESGHPDTAGQVLTKAAKMVEDSSPAKAAQYYLSTADLHETEEKYRDAASAVRYGVNMYARLRDFDTLLGALYKLKNLYELTNQYKHMYEAAAIEVAVHLHRGDVNAASDCFSNASVGMKGFHHSDVAPLLDSLLEAYREGDIETLHKCCDDSLFRTMDNEMAKLVRDLKGKADVFGVSGRSTVTGNMAGESSLITGEMTGATSLIADQPATTEQPPDNNDEEPTDEYEGLN